MVKEILAIRNEANNKENTIDHTLMHQKTA